MTTEERVQALEESLTRLEAAVGQYTTAMSQADLDAFTSNPDNMLPNGEWPLFVRQRMLNFNADSVWVTLAGIRSELDAIDFCDEVPSGTIEVQNGTPFPVGTQVIEGDIVFKGRVGIGGLNAESASQLHILPTPLTGDASIHFQTAQGDVTTKSLSGDAGMRDLGNQMITVAKNQAIDPDSGTPYTNQLKAVNPEKIQSQIGTDSLQQFSIKRTVPAGHPEYQNEHEYTQDAVLKIYEDQKVIAWESWRKGWTWKLGVDAKYGPGKWWTALFG